jgi:hypothetical protein
VGLRKWLARFTSNPVAFAPVYAERVLGMTESLAASIVAFSGQRAVPHESDLDPETLKVAFDDHYDMEVLGFDVAERDIARLISPKVEDFRNGPFAGLVTRLTPVLTTFLYSCSRHAARRHFRAENARRFSEALFTAIVSLSVGRPGFSSDPRQVAFMIDSLGPLFNGKLVLNEQSWGQGDALRCILDQVCLSDDNETQFGFVVGSPKQKLGCAMALSEVLLAIDDLIKSCAIDYRW